METVGYCVRVQALEGYSQKIQFAMSLQYDNIIAVKHRGEKRENPHYHIVVRTDIQQQAFRKRMKTLFPDGKGNEHMSIKSWDGNDKALSYLFHEETTDKEAELILVKGITDERLEHFRNMNLNIQEEVVKAKSKSSHLLWETALKHFKQHPPESHRHVAHYMILDALRNDKYVPQLWLLKAMTYKVMFLLQNGDVKHEEEQASHILAEMWRTFD